MTEKRDSSLSFALAELESLEKDRLSSEEREREARTSRRREARARVAERARRAEEARAAADAEAVRLEQERQREESARAEALQAAELERVRAEVDARTRIERERAAQQHAVDLEKVRAGFVRSRYRAVLSVGAFVVVGLGALSAWLWAKLEALESARAEAETKAKWNHDAYESSVRDLDRTRREAGELQRALDVARTDATGLQPHGPSDAPKPGHPRGKGEPSHPTAKCTNDGDPMNGCLNE